MAAKSTRQRRGTHRGTRNESPLQSFAELSAILIGQPAAAATAKRHFGALQKIKHHPLDAVLERFRQIKTAGGDLPQGVKDRLLNDAALGPFVKAIAYLWFTGQWQVGPAAPLLNSQEDYFQALMWSSVGAHPPALSDGYFGHWRYPPDTGI